ncbi:sensor histidine kinase [Halonotius terrestris]|uniref:histidine kinase n=1 Tax=Halonotius terrestris TaxID=2487750 RepID=A0A8J8TBQ2_9EURY|nr:ATP-binding protein [Halonotius terrestris]TQQ81187.1 sensor histidine kinase [Halonotius terrestris]
MRIKYRFLVAFVLVAAITGGLLFVSFEYYQSELEASVDDRIDDHTADVVTFLDSRLASQRQTTRVAATDSALQAHGTAAQQAALRAFVDRSAFQGASVVDANGMMVAITGVNETEQASLLGESFADRPYVQRALANETTISEPFMADSGNEIVVISTPIRADNGTIVGSLNAAYHLTDTTLFAPLDEGDDAIGLAVTDNGRSLYSTATFDESMTHSQSLTTTDWTVTTHYDSAAVERAFWDLAIVQLLVSVGIIGTITGFGLFVHYSEIRHAERLSRRIENVEDRTYDDDIEFSGPTEWREIGAALDRLSTTLANREQMLVVFNRFLRHNLRNELNVVTGYATELKEEVSDPDAEQQVERITAAAESVLSTAERARFTDQLLDPNRDEREPRELVAILTDEIETVTDEYPDLSVELTTPESVSVPAAETLSVAVRELITNVAVHGGESPTVRLSVTLAADGDAVDIRVADDGPGLPPGEAAVVNGEQEVTPLTHSSGFGLWLANWVVEQHDGELSIPETNDGTTVVIRLPTTPASASDQ